MGEHARRQVPLKERRVAARIRLRIDRSLGLETPEWIKELALEDGEGASVTYAEEVARKQEAWEAFCRAEDYDPNDTALWVAYSCGWQDGAHSAQGENNE